MLEQYHFLKCEERFFSCNIINSPYRGLKYSVLIFVEKIYKMQHLEGSGTPVLYIQDARFLKVKLISTTAASKRPHTFSFTEQYSVGINNSFLALYILVCLQLLYLMTLMTDGEMISLFMISPFTSPTQAKRQCKQFPDHAGLCSTIKVSDVLKPRHSFGNVLVLSKVSVLYSVHSEYRHKHNYTSNRH